MLPEHRLQVVLVNPEIPPNTGNIARTCAATATGLHLVGRLGFSLDDRTLKRAGLDYWQHVDLHYHPGFASLRNGHPGDRFVLTSALCGCPLWDFRFAANDWLVFGSESSGLAPEILDAPGATILTIPHLSTVRGLNLSNAVAIVLYEALRQFRNLS